MQSFIREEHRGRERMKGRCGVALLALAIVLSAVVVCVPSGASAAAGWTYTGLGGHISGLASYGASLYAGSTNGYVYRYDGGTTWFNTLGPGDWVSSVGFGGATLYSATTNGYVYRYDGGTTWSSIGRPAGYDDIYGFAYDGTKLYAGHKDGHVYRYDGGTTWFDTQGPGSSPVHSMAYDGTNVFAGCSNGHVYRYDGGTTWFDTQPSDTSIVYGLAYDGSNLYAGFSDGKVLRYDGGTTWFDTVCPGSQTYSLAYDGTHLFASCSGHVYQYNGGTSWFDAQGPTNVYMDCLAWNGTNLFVGSDRGHVYRYDGGTTWFDSLGPSTSYIVSLEWNGTNVYAGCSDGFVYRYDGGTGWFNTQGPGAVFGVSGLAWDGAHLFASSENDHVYQYNGGTSWADLGYVGPIVSSIEFCNSHLYAGCYDGTVYQYVSGTTWITAGITSGGEVYRLQCVGTTLYAGCNNGHVYIYDGGTGWADTQGPGTTRFTDFAFDGTNLYANCYNGNVYRYGGGTSWVDVGRPGGELVNSLFWTGAYLYAGASDGHIYRYCGGTTWTSYGAQVPGAGISCFSCDGLNLFAGSNQGGVFKGSATPTIYTVNASAPGGHGTATPATQTVANGASATIHITPAAGYHVASITDNGSSKPVASLYVISNVTADHNVVVTFAEDTSSTPSITSVVPQSGPPGTTVTINGSNFGTTQGSSYASFNGVKAADYPSWSDTQIKVKVPSGATTGPVTVTTSGGTSNAQTFTITAPPASKPVIDKVVPSYGPPGTEVTITGSGFGSSGAGGTGMSAAKASYVSFNGVAATNYRTWTDTRIVCTVPEGATAGPVWVVTPAGSSNKTRAFTVSYPTWYLAEGTSAYGFETYVTIMNPNDKAVTASVTYMTGAGAKTRPDLTLPPMSQTVINPRDDLGATDFSTKVTCREGKTIAVDRRMTWTGPGAPSPEGHSSVGVTSPEKTWYLAEGSASWGFECYLLIQNPNPKPATCKVTYMIENLGPRTITHTVPANSRATFSMAEDIPDVAIKDASIKVTSSLPVIPERAMYRNSRREGHDSIGTTTPAHDYYLAEGATGYDVGYITYVLVQNPNTTPADVNLTYMTQSGQVAGPSFTMPPNSRHTVRVNDQLPSGTDVSTRVHGTQPIIAERAMYWGAGTPLGEACHDSVGMASPHTTFYLPDGQSSNSYETWTLVQNPNPTDVTVDITYMTPSGKGNVTRTETVKGNSRKTFNMAVHSGISGRASIMVTSKTPGKKIMVERAMYWNNRGAGTDTIGGYGD